MQTEIPPASLEKGNAIFHKVKEKEKHLLDGRREPSRTFRSRLTRNDKTQIFISPPKIFKKYNRINRIDVATSGMADALVNHSWIYSIRGPHPFPYRRKVDNSSLSIRFLLTVYPECVLRSSGVHRDDIRSNYQNLIQNEFLISSVNRLDVWI